MTSTPNTTHPGPGCPIRWQCILPPMDIPDLFQAVFLAAELPGTAEKGVGIWRLYDPDGLVLYEVRGTSGEVPEDAPAIVQHLFDHAFRLFPEAFGLRGEGARQPVSSAGATVIHRKYA